MSPSPVPYPAPGPRVRIAAWTAAATVTCSIVAALLLSFHSRGPETWLAPSPELLELAAGCDRRSTRELRDRCKQELVAARLAHEKRATQLARR